MNESSRGWIRATGRELLLFSLFVLIAIAWTWPVARHLPTSVSDQGDPVLNTWILNWDLWAFFNDPLHLYDARIFVPAKFPLAYSENMFGIAILMIPAKLAGLTPLTIYNLAMLAGLAFSAYGGSVLARTAGASRFASTLAALPFAFGQFKVDHLPHLQILWSGWLPLMLAALIYYWRRAGKRAAALLCAAFVMNGLTNIYWLLFGSVALMCAIAFLAVTDARRDRRFWIDLGGALVLAGLILLPVLIPYRIVSEL